MKTVKQGDEVQVKKRVTFAGQEEIRILIESTERY